MFGSCHHQVKSIRRSFLAASTVSGALCQNVSMYLVNRLQEATQSFSNSQSTYLKSEQFCPSLKSRQYGIWQVPMFQRLNLARKNRSWSTLVRKMTQLPPAAKPTGFWEQSSVRLGPKTTSSSWKKTPRWSNRGKERSNLWSSQSRTSTSYSKSLPSWFQSRCGLHFNWFAIRKKDVFVVFVSWK